MDALFHYPDIWWKKSEQLSGKKKERKKSGRTFSCVETTYQVFFYRQYQSISSYPTINIINKMLTRCAHE